MSTLPARPAPATNLPDLITAAIKAVAEEVEASHDYRAGLITARDHDAILRVRRDALVAVFAAAQVYEFPALAELDRRAAS